MSEQKLLPCPFCGGEAELFNLGGFEVMCRGCDTNIVGRDTTKVAAITAWNTRTQPSSKATAEQVDSSNFVQTVPDHCDRIVWRGHYYHLPISAQVESAWRPISDEEILALTAKHGHLVEDKGEYVLYGLNIAAFARDLVVMPR